MGGSNGNCIDSDIEHVKENQIIHTKSSGIIADRSCAIDDSKIDGHGGC